VIYSYLLEKIFAVDDDVGNGDEGNARYDICFTHVVFAAKVRRCENVIWRFWGVSGGLRELLGDKVGYTLISGRNIAYTLLFIT
jgi:hypothetical protein